MEPNILRTLSYGMYAIGVKGNSGPSACIVNTVMQVTNTAPLMITLSMSRDNYSCQCIKEHKLFTVAVLSEDTSGAVVGALGFTSGKNGGKLSNIRHKVLREGGAGDPGKYLLLVFVPDGGLYGKPHPYAVFGGDHRRQRAYPAQAHDL